MITYLIRKTLHAVVALFGISIVTFGLLRLAPGDIAERLAGEKATTELLRNIREYYGLDKPLYLQYLRYAGGLLRGDLGESYVYRKPVSTAILEKLPATTQLALVSGAILLVGIPLGILFALRANTWVDRVGISLSVLVNSFPPFWLGIVLIYVFGFVLGIFPLGGYGTPMHFVLPAVTSAARAVPWISMLTRSSFLDIMRQDFVLVARAKGLRSKVILLRHELPNAILPVVTMWNMQFAFFFSGLVIVEAVFAWPGIGWQGWTAVRNRDIPLVLGTVLFASIVVMMMNLLTDILYVLIDPRIRHD